MKSRGCAAALLCPPFPAPARLAAPSHPATPLISCFPLILCFSTPHAVCLALHPSFHASPSPMSCFHLLQVKKTDIVNLQNREETGFSWQSMIEEGHIE